MLPLRLTRLCRLAALASSLVPAWAHAQDERALAEKLQNPIANIISVPIQNNWDVGYGSADAVRYTANIQPVTPIVLDANWNLIVRTILPVIYAQSPVPGGPDKLGLGDTVQSFFVSPVKPVLGWLVGLGPALLYPTATDKLGGERFAVGPTIVLLRQQYGFTYGVLCNHLWSFSGWGSDELSATLVQPFLAFVTKTSTTFSVSAEASYDWVHRLGSVPVVLSASQLLKIRKLPFSVGIGAKYYAVTPVDGPSWGLRLTLTSLLPIR